MHAVGLSTKQQMGAWAKAGRNYREERKASTLHQNAIAQDGSIQTKSFFPCAHIVCRPQIFFFSPGGSEPETDVAPPLRSLNNKDSSSKGHTSTCYPYQII